MVSVKLAVLSTALLALLTFSPQPAESKQLRLKFYRFDDKSACQTVDKNQAIGQDVLTSSNNENEGTCKSWNDGKGFDSLVYEVKGKIGQWKIWEAYGNCSLTVYDGSDCEGKVVFEKYMINQSTKFNHCWDEFVVDESTGQPLQGHSVRFNCKGNCADFVEDCQFRTTW